ncbi:unnamed protein product [Cylindrotheca closterium]|uniref:NAD(P)-binding domain-containing protein n=1 Tax=Cylindrotheca closterium TaxID=2856 RepID=A0AAD2FH35_9STRA|nr:unnamed protein product [Cylindrotheca closterium]
MMLPRLNSHRYETNGVTSTMWIRRVSFLLCGICAAVSLSIGHTFSDEMGDNNPRKGTGVPNSVHPQDQYYYRLPEMTQKMLADFKGPNGPKPTVMVTGAAGFVGMWTCLALKKIGMTPIGYDVVNNYYSTDLKQSRIAKLKENGIEFVKGDVCDVGKLKETISNHQITRIIHLAAQAGVRYSLDHPMEYTRNNIDCFVYLLETIVELGLHKNGRFVYASSSSVYGNNKKVPFQESDRLEDPASLYASTKRTDELIGQTYYNLHNVSSIGLRFFTVYGAYGRPDMAPWIFSEKIMSNETIQVFNHGKSRRDFTYVEDIVQGVVNSLFVVPGQPELINLGNGRPVVLADFVRLVEKEVGWEAKKNHIGMQKGDVPVTYADITKARRMLGYNPNTPIEKGIADFVTWFRDANALQYRMTKSTS